MNYFVTTSTGLSLKLYVTVLVKIFSRTLTHPHAHISVSPWRSCATGPTLDSLARPSHIIRLSSDPTTQPWPSPWNRNSASINDCSLFSQILQILAYIVGHSDVFISSCDSKLRW